MGYNRQQTKMKKYLLMIVAVFMSATMAFVHADQRSCKIRGASDGGSIEVIGCSHSKNIVEVLVANDSQDPAKVRITVSVKCNDNKEYKKSTPYPVYIPGHTPSQKVTIDMGDIIPTNKQILSESVDSITGDKCETNK